MKSKLSMAKIWLVLGTVCLCLVPRLSSQSANVSAFAKNLNNPRGLKFGPDGYLYVAEGGAGGTRSTVGQCEQAAGLPAGPGPYTGGFTARISKIDRHGVRTTVVDHLPSSQTSLDFGSLVSGVADVAFIDDTLYALIGGAGCSHGLAKTSNGVIRVNSHGGWKQIADLSAFQMAHPVAHPERDDFEPDGTWYSMIAVHEGLFAIEPNHGELDLITTDGKVHRVADISATQGHIVPTSVAFKDGNFYVGNLNVFPIVDGSSKILKITPWGKVTTVATGFTTILGLAFDRRDRLYVLENTTGSPSPKPGTGKVLRIEHSGKVTEIATGLSVPTALTFGPDGNLYVSNVGFGAPPIGLGQVVKIAVPDNDDRDEDHE
jgi:hypothetical protein